MQFLDTAIELRVYTMQHAVKIPKRYTFISANVISDMAAFILDNVKMGNSIYPTNANEVQMRRNHFIEARAKLYSMISELEVGAQAYGISAQAMSEWTALIRAEINLLSGLLKKDQERYRTLTSK